MNEKQFLDLLDSQLLKLQQNERADIRRDFEEYFENGRAEGKTTEEIVKALGSIEEITEELLAAYEEEDLTDAILLTDKDLAVPYRNIQVDVDEVNFSIVSTDAPSARIEVKDKEDMTDATMVIENDTLVVKVKRREKSFRFLFIYFVKGALNSASVVLHVPKQQYEQLTINNSNGSITLTEIEAKQCHLEADNGRIVLNDVKGELVQAETDNGRIVLSNIHVIKASAKTDNGRIIIENCSSKEMQLETDNGHIEMKFVSGKIYAKSDNGRIEAEVETVKYPLEFRTDNGRIVLNSHGKLENVTIEANTSFGGISIYDEKIATYSDGTKENKIKLKTSNGRITVAECEAVIVTV